jgi:hypothetical protein
MGTKHFDITFLEDALALGNKKSGLEIIKSLSLDLEMNHTILIERIPNNSAPVHLRMLKKGDSNTEIFIAHWKNLFDNIS